jgi:hypothetical protein
MHVIFSSYLVGNMLKAIEGTLKRTHSKSTSKTMEIAKVRATPTSSLFF